MNCLNPGPCSSKWIMHAWEKREGPSLGLPLQWQWKFREHGDNPGEGDLSSFWIHCCRVWPSTEWECCSLKAWIDTLLLHEMLVNMIIFPVRYHAVDQWPMNKRMYRIPTCCSFLTCTESLFFIKHTQKHIMTSSRAHVIYKKSNTLS